MNPTALRAIILVCLAKLLFKLVEKQFTVNDPDRFQWNATSPPAGDQQICTFNDRRPDHNESSISVITAWINTSRYLLPVLGGLLSSAWLGYVRVIQIGGVVMLLSSVLMSVSIYTGLMCQPSSLIVVTWLLLPVFFGLIQPNILYGIFLWSRENHKYSTMVVAFYYVIASFGEWFSLMLPWKKEQSSVVTFLPTASSVVMIGISFLIPKETQEGHCDTKFVMPRRLRMNRYFRIFSSLILFLISVNGAQSTVYESELRHYLNDTSLRHLSLNSYTWLNPEVLKQISKTLFALILLSVAYFSSRKISIQFRIQTGILLGAALSLGFVIFTALNGTSDKTILLIVYPMASILNGLTEILVMVASYELGNMIAPIDSKAFVLGIMFTVWGLSNIISRILLSVTGLPFTEDPELHSSHGKTSQLFAYHLASFVALIISWIYNRFQAFPLAIQITPAEESDELLRTNVSDNLIDSRQDDQLEPLLLISTRL